MKRKWIAALTAMMISAVMAVPQIPLNAQAAVVQEDAVLYGASSANGTEKDTDGDGVTDNGFVYITSGNTATIKEYRGTATALTVPLRIEVGSGTSSSSGSGTSGTTTATGYDVTVIDSAAFAGNAGLTSVTMLGGSTTGNNNSSSTAATGLLTIRERAFYGCPSLTTVTIPATVTSIGSQAFSDCPALTALNVNAGNQSYVSNDGVLYEYVGYNGSSGTGSGAYNTYTLLQYPSGKLSASYTAPAAIASRLTAISQGAFAGAQALSSITLPESVQVIGEEAFRNCTALTTVAIPDKVTAVPKYAFSGCTALTSVSIPDDTVSIGEGAFENCYVLETIKLPSKLTSISPSTFYGCSKLSEVTIPSGVVNIGSTAFAYCASLVKITVPATVTSIGQNAFLGVYGLTMYCHSGSQAASYASSNKIGTVMTYTVKFLSDTGTLLSSQEVVYGSSAVAPTMPERPGYKLTWSCSFKNVVSDLTVTATYARVYTVTFIDGYQNKKATAQVEYGKAATAPKWTMSGYTIKWSKSFSNVTGDMTVYASWKDPATGFIIDKDTVKPAKKNTQLTKGTAVYKVTVSDVQDPKVRYVSNTNAAATSVSIPSTVTINGVKYKVTRIDANAFASNANLKSVTIGSNVVAISSKAFYKCKNLSKVKINSKNLTSISSKAFYGIKNNATFYAYRSKLKSYQSKIKKSGINTTIRLKAIS
ncbi:MAG: leucine-rich repeat protein [Lachnospiraceae bacterium]|nr:leucine-rich repeat protein [bacterium]MDY5518543.1 leucine-rich repeat protein [Lachnospiraceae bacterium]